MFSVSLDQAAQELQAGRLLIYPTETSYGLGALPSSSQALQELLKLKQRGLEKGLILLVNSIEQARNYCSEISPLAQKLMQQFWPGPLTLVLPARQGLDPLLTGASGWIALRHSPHPGVLNLLKILKEPLVSTSANRSGQEPAFLLSQIKTYFDAEKIALLSEGDLKPGPMSTVLKIDGNTWTCLREGKILLPDIAS